MSPRYEVDIPGERAADPKEASRNLDGKIETPEELKRRFLNEFTIATGTYKAKRLFQIPRRITKHHSLRDDDLLICELTELKRGDKAEPMNADVLVRVWLEEELFFGQFTDAIDKHFPYGGTARIRIKGKFFNSGTNKKLSNQSR